MADSTEETGVAAEVMGTPKTPQIPKTDSINSVENTPTATEVGCLEI